MATACSPESQNRRPQPNRELGLPVEKINRSMTGAGEEGAAEAAPGSPEAVTVAAAPPLPPAKEHDVD